MKNLKDVVDKYLLDNWIQITKDKSIQGFRWDVIAAKIKGCDLGGEYVRNRYRKLREKTKNIKSWTEQQMDKLEEQANIQFQENIGKKENHVSVSGNVTKFSYLSGKEDKSKGSKEFTFTADNIPTEEEIINHFNINTKKFRINQIYHKTSFGGKYAITVNLLAIKGIESKDYEKQFSDFVKKYNEIIFVNQTETKYKEKWDKEKDIRKSLYLCCLADLHIGNYQKEGYLEQVKQRVTETFKGLVNNNVEKIVILNTGDLLHTNGSNGQTQQGTQLDSELPFEDAFTQGLDFITSIIDYATSLALSITFINVRGNHSFDTEYCMGEALKRIYKTSKNIEIINQKDTRIYYYWNNNAFCFTHGDKAVERLPLLFATEGKEVFQKAENHHVILGHLHFSKGKQFINDRAEFAGIEVRVVGSPSSNDVWHKNNGFVQNKKCITGMLFTPEEGKYAEFNFKLFK